MTKPHRATPEQWEFIERIADTSSTYSCIFELRARIEALEAQPEPVAPTDDNLRGIFCRFCDEGDNGPPWIESEEFIQAARAVLARWGTPANNTRGTH